MAYWITRPIDEAERLADRMLAAGLEPLVAPLLHVDFPCPDLGLVPEAIGGIIVTSRNGIRGAAVSSFEPAWLDAPLFAVGEATADLARRYGFRDIHVGAGRAASLPALIEATGLESDKPLLHLTGDEQAFDMKAAIEASGRDYIAIETYRIVEATRLTDGQLDKLKQGLVEGVILLSPRTARCYCRVMAAAGCLDLVARLKHVCFSPAVAAALLDGLEAAGLHDEANAGEILVTDEPSVEALITLLKSISV